MSPGRCSLVVLAGLFITLSGSLQLYGQELPADTVRYLYARVVDRTDGRAVQFAHVLNLTTGRGNISDTLGYFGVRVHIMDVIKVSAIGYYDYSFHITESFLAYSLVPAINLRPRSYEIDAVNVNPLGTYTQFKYKMLNLELPEPELQINPVFIRKIELGMDTLNVIAPMSLGSPVTALYNLLSKEGKSRRKLAQLLEEEELEKKLYPKFNRDMVGRVTGLDGTELNEFIEFCNFDPDFLLGSTDYQITQAILECLEKWEDRK